MTAQVVTIRDPQSEASADILVSLGFNCFRFTTRSQDQTLEGLYSQPNFAAGTQRPTGSGIPILFPFPGRIAGTTFEWQGKRYTLETGDSLGNAIHGFVHQRAWRVTEQTESRVVGQFHAWQDDPSLKERWPADFLITAAYSLHGNSLRCEYALENPGQTPLPCGFGVHPYFRIPFLANSAAANQRGADYLVKLPVGAQWELINMLPTGRRLKFSPEEAARYANGQKFAEMRYDDVFADLAYNGRWCEASIDDPDRTHAMKLRFSDLFRECVVYTPPHREAICIEPYTCVPGPFDLERRGIDSGLRVIEPGEQLRAVVEITLA
jgi:aldose 1-epimerase